MTPSAEILNEALEVSQSTKLKEKTPLEAISHGDVLPDIPTFPTFKEHRRHILTHMAATFRYFARQNYVEGQSGHISVRDPEFPNLMWMNPLSRHFGMLTAGDMLCIDISSGEIVGGAPNPATGGRTVNMAGYYIHSAVHLRRPDIHAICHAHGISGRAWSVFGRPLDMLTQDVCNFYGILAIYDAYDGIVFGPQEGINIAEALGSNKKAAILMNHGLLTCGETVDEAGFMFGLLERSCEIQLQAEAAAANGIPKNIITDEEAAYNFKMASEKNALYREAQPDIEFEFFLAGGEEVLARGFDKLALPNGANSTS
ncbi:Aldolase-II domain-containing protein [Fusarium keratoplasticum]|uniref:Aldolase-II domain-containing protein n=1 Tax=Fusarium keratoplasticum TaxID=1328300 RepID=A0ACC0RAW4_9HYPO|nr:Aldolase-II domain-containing protein [Fusarium keratoplasticum]KAI8679853.1 Aldolase-II domain-containing protein [Fusarium keratoplasticum]